MITLHERMKVGPKGQVVIPKSFRKIYHIMPGDEVFFEQDERGALIQKPSKDIFELAHDLSSKIKKSVKVDSDRDYYTQIEKRQKRAGL